VLRVHMVGMKGEGQQPAMRRVRPRKPENVNGVPRHNGRYAGRIRMEVVPDRVPQDRCAALSRRRSSPEPWW
jgi:hypothetical protein